MNIRCVKMRRTGLVTTWVQELSKDGLGRIIDHDPSGLVVLDVYSKLENGRDVRLDGESISVRDRKDAVVLYSFYLTNEREPKALQGYYYENEVS